MQAIEEFGEGLGRGEGSCAGCAPPDTSLRQVHEGRGVQSGLSSTQERDGLGRGSCTERMYCGTHTLARGQGGVVRLDWKWTRGGSRRMGVVVVVVMVVVLVVVV